jgi:hypothetical protein
VREGDIFRVVMEVERGRKRSDRQVIIRTLAFVLH